MTTKQKVIQEILEKQAHYQPKQSGQAFAPSNIALCKYWGKRNSELNLPITSSLSISLADKGAYTTIGHSDREQVYLNHELVPMDHPFALRVSTFLDLFRPSQDIRYRLDTTLNIPVAAGLASSACGLAALVSALDDLYGWQLPKSTLSILARLGSGSAARSLWHGFVEWHAGQQPNGLDSFAELLPTIWPEFRIGLHILHSQQKPISSREAMQITVNTSVLYQSWPQQVAQDLLKLKPAIINHDFEQLGATAENNALAMHATMQSSWQPIVYSKPETLAAMQQVWELRKQGIPVYFTQDAGPNLKLLFLENNLLAIKNIFPNLEVIAPFPEENKI